MFDRVRSDLTTLVETLQDILDERIGVDGMGVEKVVALRSGCLGNSRTTYFAPLLGWTRSYMHSQSARYEERWSAAALAREDEKRIRL